MSWQNLDQKLNRVRSKLSFLESILTQVGSHQSLSLNSREVDGLAFLLEEIEQDLESAHMLVMGPLSKGGGHEA